MTLPCILGAYVKILYNFMGSGDLTSCFCLMFVCRMYRLTGLDQILSFVAFGVATKNEQTV